MKLFIKKKREKISTIQSIKLGEIIHFFHEHNSPKRTCLYMILDGILKCLCFYFFLLNFKKKIHYV